MLNKSYFVVEGTPTDKAEGRAAILQDHLDFMIGLERAGRLFGSGPIVGGDGKPNGHGLTILRCADRNEAEAIAREDPYVKAGYRTFEVREWRLMEGRVSLKVDFSSGSYEWD